MRFSFTLPVEAKIEEGFIDGSTHSSKKTQGKWNFGHCHDLLLKLPESNNTNGKKHPFCAVIILFHTSLFSEYVKLFFYIISIDSWKRERLLG